MLARMAVTTDFRLCGNLVSGAHRGHRRWAGDSSVSLPVDPGQAVWPVAGFRRALRATYFVSHTAL